QFRPEEIELMAELEHERWREDQSLKGWTYGPGSKDPKKKTHPALLPWQDLPEEEKEKNRASTRESPGLLARAGFQVSSTHLIIGGNKLRNSAAASETTAT
ncbi:MAG: RyR domain-containing protein, partial [Candidatus Promineifilaceae bacterium]